MRILLITQGVSRVVRPVISSGHEVVGILESMPREYSGESRGSTLFRLLRWAYSIIKSKNSSLRDFCTKKNIPYHILWRGNQLEVNEWVEGLKPDLVVVFSMSQLLTRDFLTITPLGVINLHPSLLPNYRGPNPDFWQYYDMEMNPGVTVHYVDPGEDTGDIIYQERMNISLGDKSPVRLDKLIGELGVSLLIKAIDSIAEGNAPRIPQPMQSPTVRARNLKPEEHTKLIDWYNWPVERVWHVLRGTELWLNAIEQPAGLMAGQRWSIRDYERTELRVGVPSETGIYKNRKCIFCNDGVVYVGIDFNLKKSILKFVNG